MNRRVSRHRRAEPPVAARLRPDIFDRRVIFFPLSFPRAEIFARKDRRARGRLVPPPPRTFRNNVIRSRARDSENFAREMRSRSTWDSFLRFS